MFKSWWQRLLNNRKSSTANARRQRRRNHVRLHIDQLESRLTPASGNLTAAITTTPAGSTLTITEQDPSSAGINGITITEAATFGELTVGVPNGSTITVGGQSQGASFTTPKPISALTIKLASGPDTLTIGDTTFASTLGLPGNLMISSTGGDKTLNVDSVSLLHAGKLSVSFPGNGAITETFTNVNVGGTATINQPGAGQNTDALSILSSTNTAYTWGGLTLTDSGAYTNNIGDTNFLGNVTVNSQGTTSFINTNDKNLANIGGNLSISAGTHPNSGVTDEVCDYNVHGNVTINTGPGAMNQSTFVGIENSQVATGLPVIGGNVSVTGGGGSTSSWICDVGTGANNPGNGNASDLPLTVLGNVIITANGGGSSGAGIILNDLNVPNGTTKITLGGGMDDVTVQAGTGLTSVYNNFMLVSNATGGNINIQDQAGTLVFGGNVSIQINVSTSSTVNFGADTNNDTGFPGALVELFGTTIITAPKPKNMGQDTFFGAPGKVVNSNILSFIKPSISSNFMFS